MGAKINKPVYFVLNRMNEDALELRDLVDKERIVGILPFDTGVFKACLKGDSVPQIKEMKDIVDRLRTE
jgi:CO dehydrogenase maturation factor